MFDPAKHLKGNSIELWRKCTTPKARNSNNHQYGVQRDSQNCDAKFHIHIYDVLGDFLSFNPLSSLGGLAFPSTPGEEDAGPTGTVGCV